MTVLSGFDDVIAGLAAQVDALHAAVAATGGEPPDLGPDLAALIDALAALFERQQGGAPAACLGPLLPGATFVGGARVPGSSLELEPSQAAYCVAWLSGSAHLGALLPLTDYLSRRAVMSGARPLRVAQLLQAARESRALARSLRLPPSFAALPGASTLTTRVAVAGVAARLLGVRAEVIAGSLSLAFGEGVTPHDGTMERACAAAASAGVRSALLARAGAPPMPRVLTARPGGFEATLLGGESIALDPPPPPGPPEDAPEPLAAWHRFGLAVEARYPAKQAARLLGALQAETALAQMPVQSFVAHLVRAA